MDPGNEGVRECLDYTLQPAIVRGKQSVTQGDSHDGVVTHPEMDTGAAAIGRAFE